MLPVVSYRTTILEKCIEKRLILTRRQFFFSGTCSSRYRLTRCRISGLKICRTVALSGCHCPLEFVAFKKGKLSKKIVTQTNYLTLEVALVLLVELPDAVPVGPLGVRVNVHLDHPIAHGLPDLRLQPIHTPYFIWYGQKMG